MRFDRIGILVILCAALAGNLPAAPKRPDGKGQVPGKQAKIEDPEVKAARTRIEKLRLEQQELRLKNSIAEERLKARLARLRAESQLLQAQNAKDRELLNLKNANFQKEKNRISLELQRIGLRNTRLNLLKSEQSAKLAELQIRLRKRKAEQDWKDSVNQPVRYTTQPLAKGRMLISDRLVKLDGPIFDGMADKIVDEIHFYNNKSERFPIFLVIGSSPGGSVMAGSRIIEAIRSSRAPVYVVIKSYAASMAAIIAATAPRAYALPNAIILHHQVSSYSRGNVTQQKERLELTEEWMRRVVTPVAKKMGLSLERFVALMYKNNSDGNWREFAHKAARLKWISGVITRLEEQSVRSKPAPPRIRLRRFFLREERDKQGRVFVRLPRLQPYDVYFLHDPSGYYRR